MANSEAGRVVVRDARAEDDHDVGELLVEAFVTTYAKKMPEVQVTERRKRELRAVTEKRKVARVWVAEVDGEIAGTVALWPPGAPGSEAWLPNAADLRHLAVSPRHHGRGISKLLMETAESQAWALGVDAICLHVRRGAIGVAQLYEARGYVRTPEGDLDFLPDVFLEAWVLRRRVGA